MTFGWIVYHLNHLKLGSYHVCCLFSGKWKSALNNVYWHSFFSDYHPFLCVLCFIVLPQNCMWSGLSITCKYGKLLFIVFMFYLYWGLAKCQCFDITLASFSKFSWKYTSVAVEWYSTIDGIYLQILNSSFQFNA